MTEAELRQKVVDTASAWLGTQEGSTRHTEMLAIYNAQNPLPRSYKMKAWDAWCAAFVSTVSLQCGLRDIMPTECGCPSMIKLYQQLGRWVEDDAYTPQPGDVIFYDWQDSGVGDNVGQSDHVGIVTSCTNGVMTIIEGNFSNAVKLRQLAVDERFIRGYGCPDYSPKASTGDSGAAGGKTETSKAKTYTVKDGDTLWGLAEMFLGAGYMYPAIVSLNDLKTTVLSVGQVLTIPGSGQAQKPQDGVSAETCQVTLPLLKNGSTGLSVRAVQTLLNMRGVTVKVDGIFGEETDAAVRKFQTAAKLLVDGEVGAETWTAIIAA